MTDTTSTRDTPEAADHRAATAPTGALATLRALLDRGVDVCFANPGTSEMHFVAAVDQTPAMRCVLALFEGVATGAADGYGRLAGRPAVALLHLGPGLANGLANLHNARRARTPVVALVGEHAVDHRRLDPPLAADIEGLARPVSGWVTTVTDGARLVASVDAAVTAALGPPATVATMVVPADLSWTPVPARPATAAVGDGAAPSDLLAAGRTDLRWAGDATPPTEPVGPAAAALRGDEPTAIVIGGRMTTGTALRRCAQLAAWCGARLLCETFPARLEHGAGAPPVERLGYLAELAQLQLAGLRHLVVLDTAVPVSFFAYPDRPGELVPDGCQVHVVAGAQDDADVALAALVDAVGVPDGAPIPTAERGRPGRPTGALTAESVAAAVGAVLPEGAIVSDESNTCGLHLPGATAGAPRHDWLTLTGGAIGQGLPVATGAAVAAPDRPVVCLEADGSAMYTLQALWTQAREGLDVTTVVLDNRAYGILEFELARVGAGTAGPVAASLLELGRPNLDFVALARGMGVPASSVTSADELTATLERCFAEPGPHLVHVPLPRAL
jgi:acetolactate synthase-1/2/3 large subunit